MAGVADYPRNQAELERRFGQEVTCRAFLAGLRWPGGFVCPTCLRRAGWETGRGLWMCHGCGRQTSVTAGTIFHRTHINLTTWFRAAWWVTSQKNGASAVGLQRALGIGNYQCVNGGLDPRKSGGLARAWMSSAWVGTTASGRRQGIQPQEP